MATPPQQHHWGYATTASPWWLWFGDSMSLYTTDHADIQGFAQANDEQHRDHRYEERRLRPLWGLEDIMHLPISITVYRHRRVPYLYFQ